MDLEREVGRPVACPAAPRPVRAPVVQAIVAGSAVGLAGICASPVYCAVLGSVPFAFGEFAALFLDILRASALTGIVLGLLAARATRGISSLRLLLEALLASYLLIAIQCASRYLTHATSPVWGSSATSPAEYVDYLLSYPTWLHAIGNGLGFFLATNCTGRRFEGLVLDAPRLIWSFASPVFFYPFPITRERVAESFATFACVGALLPLLARAVAWTFARLGIQTEPEETDSTDPPRAAS
ncbi:hypothetical protein HY251_01510 [bacterium]|nr:hypothetical protein [bacterium]